MTENQNKINRLNNDILEHIRCSIHDSHNNAEYPLNLAKIYSILKESDAEYKPVDIIIEQTEINKLMENNHL